MHTLWARVPGSISLGSDPYARATMSTTSPEIPHDAGDKAVPTQPYAITWTAETDSRIPRWAGPAPLQQDFRLTAEIRSIGAADFVHAERR